MDVLRFAAALSVLTLASAAGSGEPDVYLAYGHTGEAIKLDKPLVRDKNAPKTTIVGGGITWNITYDDVAKNNNRGFDGPDGAAAQAALAAVLRYIGTVLDHTGSVDYLVAESQTDGGGPLAQANSLVAAVPGFAQGFVQRHIITGADPSAAQQFDGTAVFDFGYEWNFNFNEPTPCTFSECRFDFFSVALHEFTHALGFFSFTKSDGKSPGNTDTRTFIDRDLETGNGKDLFANNGSGQFLGAASDLAGGDGGLVLNQPAAIAIFGSKPPVFGPSPFKQGSSLSHLDFQVPVAVMHPSLFNGEDIRVFDPLEIAVLGAIGYTIKAASPTPTPSPTPSPNPTETPTETPTPSPSETETPTPTPTSEITPTPSPTDFVPETPTPSPTPTEPPQPTETAVETPTPSPTPTEIPTDQPTPTPSETPTSSPTPSPTPEDDAVILDQNIPIEGRVGTRIPIEIRIKNTGITNWSTGDGYFMNVVSDDCALVPTTTLDLDFATVVAPGDEYLFQFTMVMPEDPGFCQLFLQMSQNEKGDFGGRISVLLWIRPLVTLDEMVQKFLLGQVSDPAGLDSNGDGVIDISDLIHAIYIDTPQ